MALHLGADQAKVFGDMHEDGAVNQMPNEKAMDLANNASGRGFAGGNPNTDEEEWEVLGACDDAARAGKLVILCGGKGQKGLLSDLECGDGGCQEGRSAFEIWERNRRCNQVSSIPQFTFLSTLIPS